MAEKKTLSLYLHFPFCMRKCRYCDFLSFPADAGERQEYVNLLCREIRARGAGSGEVRAREGDFAEYEVHTVFFGGGTPSLLETEQLALLMDAIRASFPVTDDAEISLECNPGTADRSKLSGYRQLGINRLSIGLQSAEEKELALLGRIHTAEQFFECMHAARAAGFDNINVDLMSGIPGQSVDSLRRTLETVLQLRPEHLSAYSLIIEEGTPFWETYGEYGCASGMPPLPDEDTERRMVRLTEEMLQAAGYRHYEISNYALPGCECRHNLTYWKRGEYLGLGLGAASLIGETRYRNTSDPAVYRKDFCAREESEPLTLQAQMEETMFLGLRCLEGISISAFENRFGQSLSSLYSEVITRYTRLGLLEQCGDRIRLTGRGIDVSNLVLADFLL